MKMNDLFKSTLKDASKKLTGYKRRGFQAQVSLDHFKGNARKTERELGWSRHTVEKGLNELRSGFICYDEPGRGDRKTEEKRPSLEHDIRAIIEPHSQIDPSFHSTLMYTKITAKSIRQSLIEDYGYHDEGFPTENTISAILNRLGYSLKRVQKTKPLKKIAEVDEIFENVAQANQKSDETPESLRISIDSKAKVEIGEFSRNGKSRGREAKKAADHDMGLKKKLIPFGILCVVSGIFTLVFGTSKETSDFIVDALELWWMNHKENFPGINELVINLDNGPSLKSDRTQFIRRLTEFADQTGLKIRLVYYPPYHSKYNPIERTWASLEKHWNGEILNSAKKIVSWAGNMTWKEMKPFVYVLNKVYPKGIKPSKEEIQADKERVKRSDNLPKWDVRIEPRSG